MNPDQLLKHFEDISEADDAVPRLRQFIHGLAVRGKLVEQDSTDESADELLKRIQVERSRLVKAGSVKEPVSLLALKDTEIPYAVPSGWKWTRLGDSLNSHLGGGTPSKTNGKYWGGNILWASVKDIGKTKYVHQTIDRITPEGLKNSTSNLIPEGNLIVVTRMGLGKVSINRAPMAINQDLRALFLSSLASIDYYYIFFKTASYEGSGLTVKGIKVEQLLNFPFPLPPLAEQKRIVAKVDELMALCDELEAARTKRETRRDHLVAATLHRLNNGNASPEAGNDTDFKQTARFYFNHLLRLTTRPEHVKQLRQTILSLAVGGKLARQSLNDGSASELLTAIDQERAKIAKVDRRADSELQELLEKDLFWEIPNTWMWRGVADLALFIDYRGKTPVKSTSGVRLITAKNVRPGLINLEPEEYITEKTYKSWMTRGFPKIGDILFTTEAPMGNVAVVRSDEKFGLAQRVINFRLYGKLDPDFIALQLMSEPFQAILDKTATGVTAKGIKAAKLKRLPLAVPPLAEQHRIVAKVNELMALCDELEAQLTSSAATHRQLLEATLHEALHGWQAA